MRTGRVSATQIYSDVPWFENPIAEKREECEKYLTPDQLPRTYPESLSERVLTLAADRSQLTRWLSVYNVLDIAKRTMSEVRATSPDNY